MQRYFAPIFRSFGVRVMSVLRHTGHGNRTVAFGTVDCVMRRAENHGFKYLVIDKSGRGVLKLLSVRDNKSI